MGKLNDLVQELGEKAHELVKEGKHALIAVSMEEAGNGYECDGEVVVLGRGKHVALAFNQLLEVLSKDEKEIHQLNDETKQQREGKQHVHH